VAGVDASVVSRIITGDDRLSVRPETRQRVLEVVEQLNYRPNRAARMLRTAQAMALGLIVPDLANATYAEISSGAEAESAKHGYILLIATGSPFERLKLLEGRVDGLLYAIATSQAVEETRLPERPPSLLVNRHEPRMGPSVTVDDAKAAAMATAHLVRLGHHDIGHIAGPDGVDTSRRREHGMRAELAERRLVAREDWIVPSTFDERGGYAAGMRLLSADPRPTAIFVANTRAAIGTMAAARALGISIPQDLSVIGFDDIPMAEFLTPSLTTLHRPLDQMGARAVQLLLGLIAGRSVASEMIESPSELIVRGSTAPPR
jgi:LacI family transcriptional regulator